MSYHSSKKIPPVIKAEQSYALQAGWLKVSFSFLEIGRVLQLNKLEPQTPKGALVNVFLYYLALEKGKLFI